MVAQGRFDQSDMDTSDKQKTAFDTVDMRTPITGTVIAELLRDFAIAVGKQRLQDAAATVAESLVDIGVEMYSDLRAVTYAMYVDHCGVKPIDAGRLVAHFAPPEKVEKVTVAPRRVSPGVRARMRVITANRVVDPIQGDDDDADRDDIDRKELRSRSDDVGAVEGELRSGSQPAGTTASQGEKSGLEAADSIAEGGVAGAEGLGFVDVDSEVRINHGRFSIDMEESPETPIGDPKKHPAKNPAMSEGCSGDTTVSDSDAKSQSVVKSEAQTMVESMAISVMQLTQAMHTQASAIAQQSEAQSKALTAVMAKATYDKVKLSQLKVRNNRTRPPVKVVRAWLQDIAEKLHTVAGLPAAIAALKHQPRVIKREQFIKMVSTTDDHMMYQSVRSTMSEVYQMMVDSDGCEELQSAMGLMHDTMQFALCKGDSWIAKVMHWITNEVAYNPIKEGQDIMARFEEWDNTVLEIRYTGAIENSTIIKSVYSLLP